MRRLLLLALALLPLTGCRSLGEAGAGGERLEDYVFVYLVSGPGAAGKSPQERQEIQAAHLANIERLVAERKMIVAGPFGQPNPVPARRGIFVFDVPTVEEAVELTRSDPAIAAGVLKLEALRWSASPALRTSFELYMEEEARRVTAGEPAPADMGMRSYVFGHARDAATAEAALEPLRGDGLVILFGPSSDGGAIFVLDAAEPGALDPLLAEELGEGCLLLPWWGSKSLAEIPRIEARG